MFVSPTKIGEGGMPALIVVAIIPFREKQPLPVSETTMMAAEIALDGMEHPLYHWLEGEPPSPEDWLENLNGCHESRCWQELKPTT